MKQKKFWKKNGRLKKNEFFKIANSQNFFAKISQIRPWVSRIEWCERHWCSSTYMAVRLSDKSSKTAKKCIFCTFWAVFELLSDSLTAIYVELLQYLSHHSILLTQGSIWEIFVKKFWELAILKNELFLSRPFWIFFSKKKKKIASFPWKSAQIYMVEWMGRNFDLFPGFQKIPCYA